MTLTPQQIADEVKSLRVHELAELAGLLRDIPGWPDAGVREPRVPVRPLDVTGITVDPGRGKTA